MRGHVDNCSCPFGEPGSTDDRCIALRLHEHDVADAMLEPMRERERERRGSDLSDEARFSLIARGGDVSVEIPMSQAQAEQVMTARLEPDPKHVCTRTDCNAIAAFKGMAYCSAACAAQDQPAESASEPTEQWAACQLAIGHVGNCGTLSGYPASGVFTLPPDRCGANFRVEPDISEPEPEPKCPTCDGTELVPHPCAKIDCGQRHEPDPCPTCDGRTAEQAKRQAECTVCEGTGAVQCLPHDDGSPGAYTWCAACAPPRPAPAQDFEDMASEYGFHGVTPLPRVRKVHKVRAPAGYERGDEPVPRLSALAEANERANASIYFRETEIPHPDAVDSEDRARMLRLGVLREAGIWIGWTAGRGYIISTTALDAIIQLAAEQKELKQRLERLATGRRDLRVAISVLLEEYECDL